MSIDHMGSKLSRNLLRPAILALALAAGGGALANQAPAADEPLTVQEVVTELVELTPKLTPFTIRYDKDAKTLIFNEEVESNDKAMNGRIGELRARLDRMDAKRLSYQSGHSTMMTLLVRGKPIAGYVLFHCRENVKCVSRGLYDPGAPSNVAETDDANFSIDIFDASITYAELNRFAALIRHLIVVSNPE